MAQLKQAILNIYTDKTIIHVSGIQMPAESSTEVSKLTQIKLQN